MFNMLPAFPMDGGRVLRALLAMRLPYARATRLAASVGQVMAIGFGLLGLTSGNPFLLLIALFVWIGAEGEAVQVEQRVLLKDVPVRAAMVTDFKTVGANDTLGQAADLLLAGSQQDFPVISPDGRALQGLLTRADLMAGLARGGREAPVADCMKAEIPSVEADSSLSEAIPRLRAGDGPCLQVVDRGRPAGLLTLENVGEYLMVRAALGRTPRRPTRRAGGARRPLARPASERPGRQLKLRPFSQLWQNCDALRRLIADAQVGRVERALALFLRFEAALEHAARQQRALDGVRSSARLEHLLDLVHQACRVSDVGVRRQEKLRRHDSRLTTQPGGEGVIADCAVEHEQGRAGAVGVVDEIGRRIARQPAQLAAAARFWGRPSATVNPLIVSERDSAASSSLLDQRPARPACQTASPAMSWTRLTPVSPPFRRSTMHCKASSA